jgi:hypothetical protein
MKIVVLVLFRSNDENYDWSSSLSKEPGYEFVKLEKIENIDNPRWPKWSFIITYKKIK